MDHDVSGPSGLDPRIGSGHDSISGWDLPVSIILNSHISTFLRHGSPMQIAAGNTMLHLFMNADECLDTLLTSLRLKQYIFCFSPQYSHRSILKPKVPPH